MSGGVFTDGDAAIGAAAITGVDTEGSLSERCGAYPASGDTEPVGCAMIDLLAEKALEEAGRTNPSVPCVRQAAANTRGTTTRAIASPSQWCKFEFD